MHFAILGTTQINNDGAPLQMPPMRRRALCALILARDHGLSAETLTEALWGDDDVEAHESSLKAILSHLRKALPGRIPPGSAGRYRLVLAEGDTLDADTFRTLAAEATEHAARGEHEPAARKLAGALALWGEPPLADLPDHPMMLDLGEELLDERRTARMALFDAWLHLGEYREVIRQARRELADDPVSEQLHALTMRALYRSGRRAEALQQYETAAAVLERETGSGPGAALRRLREEIAADEAGDGDRPGTAVRPMVPAQLPPDAPHFTGRVQEVDQLVSSLTGQGGGVPVVAISGPGGVGKTTLAVHAAHLVRDHFPDGQIYVHLAGMSRPRDVGEVLAEVLMSLGVRPQDLPRTPAERTGLLRSLLAGRRVLIVLDDVGGAHQVHPFVPGTPGCAVIVTSRAFLPDASMRNVRLYPLPATEALAMLGHIIGRERVQAEPAAADAVVQACNGFPLAVRIAGARLIAQPHWTLAHFAPKLSDRLRGLSAGDMAISASIADSYDALPDELQRAFRALALAGPGSFPAWVVGMLLETDDAEELLEELVMRSLVLTAGVDSLGQPRYRQHDLLRDYAAARLAENVSEQDLGLDRLLYGWLDLVDQADDHVEREPYYPPITPLRMNRAPAQARALIDADTHAWYASEVGNILAVVREACRRRRYYLACGIGFRVSSYLYSQSLHLAAEEMWRSIMHVAAESGADKTAAEARHRLASLVSRRPGGPGRALPMLDVCVEVYSREETFDRRSLARSLALRAWCFNRVASTPDAHAQEREALLRAAEEDAERAVALGREASDRHAEMTGLRAWGLVASSMGEHEAAIGYCGRAVAVAAEIGRQAGRQSYELWATRALVHVLLAAGRPGEALTLCLRAEPQVQQLRTPAREAAVAERTGDALSGLGRHEEAAAAYERAVSLYEGDWADVGRGRCVWKAAAARAAAAHHG